MNESDDNAQNNYHIKRKEEEEKTKSREADKRRDEVRTIAF